MTPSSSIKENRRRSSSCATIARRSSTVLHASISGQNEIMRTGSTVFHRPCTLIDNPSVKKYLNNNNTHPTAEQEEKKNLEDDNVRVSVQVTGSSVTDTFKTMMNARKTVYKCWE